MYKYNIKVMVEKYSIDYKISTASPAKPTLHLVVINLYLWPGVFTKHTTNKTPLETRARLSGSHGQSSRSSNTTSFERSNQCVHGNKVQIR